MPVRPNEDDIWQEIDRAEHGGGSHWPGESYENGVAAALRWAIGDADEPPMSEVDD